MKKQLLITGGYGLVGHTITKILMDKHPDIEITRVKFNAVPPGYQDFDYIIHAAGHGQPTKFMDAKVSTLLVNTAFTDYLFSRLKKDGKFLYVSTSEVYSGAEAPYTEDMIGSTTPQHPRACYIEGKRCGEAICMAYKEQGYDVKIARLSLAYGPGTKQGDTRVLNQFIEQALTTGEVRLKDKGEAKRTYCYVQDAAEIMLNILFKGKDVVYNVGGFSDITVRELADEIGMMTGAKVILGKEGLDGAPDNVCLDMTKTLREFPQDFTSMYNGLIKTIAYQKKLYGKE